MQELDIWILEIENNKNMSTENESFNKDDMPDINTGNGVDRDLAATTSDRLKKTVLAIRFLTEVIKKFNEQSSNQTKKMMGLTIVIIILTIAMLIGLFVQIQLTRKQVNYAEVQSIPDIIFQAQSKQRAVESCEQNQELEDSELFYTEGDMIGTTVSCSEVLKRYSDPTTSN